MAQNIFQFKHLLLLQLDQVLEPCHFLDKSQNVVHEVNSCTLLMYEMVLTMCERCVGSSFKSWTSLHQLKLALPISGADLLINALGATDRQNLDPIEASTRREQPQAKFVNTACLTQHDGDQLKKRLQNPAAEDPNGLLVNQRSSK